MLRLQHPLQRLQVRAQFQRGLISCFTMFLERFTYDALELCGKFRVQFAHRSGGLFQDGFLEHRTGVACECTLPCGHLVEHQAERKQVRARIQLLAAHPCCGSCGLSFSR